MPEPKTNTSLFRARSNRITYFTSSFRRSHLLLRGVIQMAGAEMLLAVHHMLDQWRADVLAYLHTVGTSGMEMAALRRMHRVWHVALQNDATVLAVWIHNGNCRQQRLRLGMRGVLKNLLR